MIISDMKSAASFCYALFLIFLPALSLQADLQIDIEYPDLEPAYDFLEDELESYVDSIGDEVDLLSNEFPDKDLMTSAVSTAATDSAIIPLLQTLPQRSSFSFSLGGYASFYAFTLEADELSDALSSLDREDDLEVGGGVRIVNGSLTFPLRALHPDLTALVSLGGGQFSRDEYTLEDFYIQGALSFVPFADRSMRSGLLSWTPLQLQTGAAYGSQKLSARYDLDRVSETLTVDPDGPGPLGDEAVTLSVEPEVEVALETWIAALSFSAATGIRLFEGLHLTAGAGCHVARGRTVISVSGSDDIELGGYLADYREDSGSVAVSGDVSGSSPDWLSAHFFTDIQFDISKMFINIPILYRPYRGVAAGLSLGVRL
jgi:hypothetical protein